jgi:hypothetical protein
MLVDFFGDYVSGGREYFLQGVTRKVPNLTDEIGAVAGVHEMVGRVRGFVVNHGCEWLEVHVDQLGGIFGHIAALCDDQTHWIANEANTLLGQWRSRSLWALGTDRRVPLLAGERVEIRRREYGMNPWQ